MYPILFEYKNITIQTYILFLILGILSGFFVLYLNIKNLDKFKKNKIFFLAIVIFIPFIIGAKLGYLFELFIIKKFFMFDIFNTSFSLIWGLIFSTLFAFCISNIIKLNVWETGDFYAISISIGGFFIRLGCLFNGCCFGIPAPDYFPFAIFFPYGTYAHQIYCDKPLYPTQLYLSLVWLFIFIFLLIYNKSKHFDGELIIIMFMIYSFFNFFIEFYRFHIEKQHLIISQILNLFIFFTAILLFLYRIKKHLLSNKKLTK